MTQHCKHSAATKEVACCSWVSAPAWVQHWSWRIHSSLWNLPISLTKKDAASKITSAVKAWRSGVRRSGGKHVQKVIKKLKSALVAEQILLGGGNAELLKTLPPGARLGDNSHAFEGGFRLWQKPYREIAPPGLVH